MASTAFHGERNYRVFSGLVHLRLPSILGGGMAELEPFKSGEEKGYELVLNGQKRSGVADLAVCAYSNQLEIIRYGGPPLTIATVDELGIYRLLLPRGKHNVITDSPIVGITIAGGRSPRLVVIESSLAPDLRSTRDLRRPFEAREARRYGLSLENYYRMLMED